MACNDIEVTKKQKTIEITDEQEVIELDSVESNILGVADKKEVVELKDEVFNTIQVANVNGQFTGGSNNIDILMNCSATEDVGDAVYIFSGMDVRQANNSDISTAKVIGFIVNKPTSTTCNVRVAGVIDAFVGMTVGSQYFLDGVDGEIIENAPTTPGSVLVRLGQAIDTDVFLIEINNNYIIRS